MKKLAIIVAMLFAMMGFGLVVANPASANIPVISNEINCDKVEAIWHGEVEFTNPEPKVENWTATTDRGTLVKSSGTIQEQTEGAQIVVDVPGVKGETSITVTLHIHASWVNGGETSTDVVLTGEGECFNDESPSPSPTPTPSDTPSPTPSSSDTPSPSATPTPSPSDSVTPSPSTSSTPSPSLSSSSPAPSESDSCTSLPPDQQTIENGCLPHTGPSDHTITMILLGFGSVIVGVILIVFVATRRLWL